MSILTSQGPKTLSRIPQRPILGTFRPSRRVSFDPTGGQRFDLPKDLLVLERLLSHPKGLFEILQSLSAVFIQNRPNSDIFPFSSIAPDHWIYIKNSILFEQLFVFNRPLTHQKPNLALLNKIVEEHPIWPPRTPKSIPGSLKIHPQTL